MKYSDFAIEQLTNKLAEIFNKKSTPTKTAALMLEAMEVIKQLQKAAALPPNPPLALDELQEMDGEPVWVKGINGSHIKSGWMLVHRELCCCKNPCGDVIFFDWYGEWWTAYRRKPEVDHE